MDNSIYETTRDEYVGFLGQIKPEARLSEFIEEDNYKFIKTYNVDKSTLFATRIIPKNENEEEHYYVWTMPSDFERCAPKAVQKIVLETKEEVQAFMNVLAEWQKGE